jgi:hypothetical protein
MNVLLLIGGGILVYMLICFLALGVLGLGRSADERRLDALERESQIGASQHKE